jgi:Kef-type K+ transport system membrane component KefB/Trk K+ transport system NAD-binding subunit
VRLLISGLLKGLLDIRRDFGKNLGPRHCEKDLNCDLLILFKATRMEHRFIPLLLVVILAFLAPIILARFKWVPAVVGEILAGILVGPSVLGWVHTGDPTLEIIAEIGFAFLMFLSGLEIDFSLLFAASKTSQDKRTNPLLLAGFSFLLTIAFAGSIGFWLTHAGFIKDPWIMTLILSTTSLGIVVPVLKEKKMSASRLGQTILVSALLADFLTMFLITVYIAIRSTGLSLDILLIALLFIPVVLLYQLGQRHLRRPIIRRLIEELADDTSQIKVRGAFALMMAFVVMAELIGAELILGAFLGGLLASLLSDPTDEKIRHKLDAIGFGFFVPLFFVYVGVRFDLHALLNNRESWFLLPVLLFAAFAIKVVSALAFRLAYSWRESVSSGLLLSARLSLIIAASAIGVRLGAITESTNAAIILVAASTAMFAPLSFNILMTASEEKKKRLKLIYGASDLAFQVGRELHAQGDDVLFVESNLDDVERARGQGFAVTPIAHSLASVIATICKDTRIDAFIALSSSDDENLEVCRTTRAYGIEHILAFVTEPIRVPDFRRLGVQSLTPSMHRSSLLAFMARNSAFFSLVTLTDDQRGLRELVLSNPALNGKRLMDLKFPANTLVLAIRRDDEMLIPSGTTRLTTGDQLTMLGELDALAPVAEWLEG